MLITCEQVSEDRHKWRLSRLSGGPEPICLASSSALRCSRSVGDLLGVLGLQSSIPSKVLSAPVEK